MLAGKKPIGEHAAVWVPDIEAKTCMHCKKNQFTFLNRRVSVWLNSNLAFNHDYLFSALHPHVVLFAFLPS